MKLIVYTDARKKVHYKILMNKRTCIQFGHADGYSNCYNSYTSFPSIGNLLESVQIENRVRTVPNNKQPRYEVLQKFRTLKELGNFYPEFMI